MDRKGAQILARRLADRHGKAQEALAPGAITDPDVAPIYRWLGIEPPSSTGPKPAVLRPEPAPE